jgi:large subunit ribosomal protein L4
MKIDVYNMQGEKLSKKADLPAGIFEAPINVDLMHQAYTRQLANARLGTHSTKGRSEVSGGGKRPWRQKGTGRARQGSTRAAQWVGGGKIFTPKPRDYSVKMPKKMRRAALCSALSVKAQENQVMVVDAFVMDAPKTKVMVDSLEKLVGSDTVLIVMPEKNENYEAVIRSANNIPNTKTLLANYLNIRDLLGYDKVILMQDSIEVLNGFLG